MSEMTEVYVPTHLRPMEFLRLSVALIGLVLVYRLALNIYDAFFGPMSKFPGPKLYAFSRIPRIYASMTGTDVALYTALHEKYGPVVRVAPKEISFAGGVEAWQDIYGFKKPGQPKPFKDPEFYIRNLNGVPGLINADDANHARQRKIVSHAFSDRALKEQGPMLLSWASKLVRKLSEFESAGKEVDLLKMYNCTTFDIMGDLTFNEGLNMLDDGEYSPWVKTIFASIKDGAFWRGFLNLSSVTKLIVDRFIMRNKRVRKMIYEHWHFTTDRVDRRLKWTPERPDLWSRIIAKSADENGLTLGEYHSNASLFMIAGTETTASELSGLTYLLTQNPKVLERLTTEIRTELRSDGDCTLERLARLKYLHACLMEGLRMYPPVPAILPRRTPAGGAMIYGEWVPEDISVGVHQFATYRSSAHFKNPHEFHPERWLDDPEYANDHRNALEPFSTGPRNCLGKNLAWHEMRLLLAMVLRNFDIELADASKNWDDQRAYIIWEKKPLICRLTAVKG